MIKDITYLKTLRLQRDSPWWTWRAWTEQTSSSFWGRGGRRVINVHLWRRNDSRASRAVLKRFLQTYKKDDGPNQDETGSMAFHFCSSTKLRKSSLVRAPWYLRKTPSLQLKYHNDQKVASDCVGLTSNDKRAVNIKHLTRESSLPVNLQCECLLQKNSWN